MKYYGKTVRVLLNWIMIDITQRKRTFFVYFTVISVSMILLSIYLRNNVFDIESEASADKVELNGSLSDISGIPEVINLVPDKAYEDKYFRHTLQITDSDTDLLDLSVELIDGPEWMRLVGFEIIGWPQVGNNSTQKVTIEITDGEHIIEDSFYIYVTESSDE